MKYLEAFVEKFLAKIHQYDTIALFCHVEPDYDAYGAVFGLYQWLNDNFHSTHPNKQVYLMIEPENLTYQERLLFKPPKQQAAVNLAAALGIIVDTANVERILTQKHIECAELINIDHHPQDEKFAALNFIDPLYPACCQILALIFMHLEPEFTFSSKVAQYLYAGIITDTNNLLNPTVLAETFSVVSYLVQKGINRILVMDSIYLKTLKQKKSEFYVTDQIQVSAHGLAFVILNKAATIKYQFDQNPSIIQLLANLVGVEIWVCFTYQPKKKVWKASLRSKNLEINHIAAQFGGGGHKKMAAVIFKHQWECYQMLVVLENYLVNMGYANSSINSYYLQWKSKLMLYYYHKQFSPLIN